MTTKKNIQKNKLNIIIPSLLLVVVFVATLMGVATSLEMTTQRMEKNLKEEVEKQAVIISDQIEKKFAILNGYGASFLQTDIDSRERMLEKLNQCREKTDFSVVCFIYPNGFLYGTDKSRVDASERTAYKESMQGRNAMEFLGGPSLSMPSRIGLSVPVVIDDEVQGVLLGIYEKEKFHTLFEGFFSEISNLSCICTSQGEFIIGTPEIEKLWVDASQELTRGGGLLNVLNHAKFIDSSKTAVMEQMNNQEGGQAVYDYDGKRRYTTYVPLGINDWYIISILPEEKIYEEVMEYAKISYIMMFLLMLAVMVTIIYLANKEHQTAEQEKKKRQELKYLSEHDDLTGVLKVKALLERVGNCLLTAKPQEYCLVYLDVYKFKLINEMFGYAKGDELLCAMAEELLNMADYYGGLCGRVSGDEFVLFLPYKEEIVKEFYTKKYREKRIIPIEFYLHYGIYVIQDTTIPVDRMIDCAQVAQKTVKGNYDNCVAFYDDKIKQQIMKEQEIITSMKQALEQEEFVVYLQPQYDYRKGAICGAEALVRWNNPTKGLILPGEFLPIFETNGFIIKLDEYMWEQVCKLQRRWLDEGRKIFPISVNVSRTDLLKGSVAEKLMSLLKEYKLTTDMIRVEITESAYMDNPQQLITEIHKLRECGLVVEMDDFGSGYSSLNMLKDLPIQVLKTDLRFLSATENKDRKDYILDSIISMAHKMGMSVVAEGVETKEQADYLLCLNCDHMQGHYFSKPVPVVDYEKLIYSDAFQTKIYT